MVPPSIPVAVQLATRVRRNTTTGCLLWTGVRLRQGYGQLVFQQRRMQAHRAAWELQNGPIPRGLFVCHHCDTPRCVEVKHLFLGTHQDNMDDKVSKHRQVRGERNTRSKLTAQQVAGVRAASGTIAQIAAKYGMGSSQICAIRLGKSWKHLAPQGSA